MSIERKIILTRRDADVVFQALENPRAPSEGLKRAAGRYKERYGKTGQASSVSSAKKGPD